MKFEHEKALDALISRYVQGKLTAEEAEALEIMIAENPRLAQKVEKHRQNNETLLFDQELADKGIETPPKAWWQENWVIPFLIIFVFAIFYFPKYRQVLHPKPAATMPTDTVKTDSLPLKK